MATGVLSAISITLAILLIVTGLSYYSLKDRYRILESSYNELRAEYVKLNSSYLELNSSYTELSENYNLIKQQYAALSEEHAKLKESYQLITANYTSLKEKYDSLRKNYQLLEDDYRLLKESYQRLAENYTSLKEDYEQLMAEYENVTAGYEHLEANLSGIKRNLELIRERILLPPDFFPTILKQSMSFSVLTLTREKLGLSKDMNPEFKARKIMEWIIRNTQYLQDDYHQYIVGSRLATRNDFASAPNETLSRRGGDCEDLAILAYAMLKSMLGEDEAVYLIAVTNGDMAHAAVLYKSRDKFIVIDPAMNYVTDARIVFVTNMFKDSSKYTVWMSPMALSPEVKQFLLENDFAKISYYDPRNPPKLSFAVYRFSNLELTVNLWLDYVDPVIPGAYVALIADDSIAKTFNSTQEFLDWMGS